MYRYKGKLFAKQSSMCKSQQWSVNLDNTTLFFFNQAPMVDVHVRAYMYSTRADN